MVMEPGRNDLCPCGSGKKYKKCCLSRVRGVAVPARPMPGEPRNTHFVRTPDGEWEERPGSLFMHVHGEPTDAPDAEIRNSFRPHLDALRNSPDLVERVRDCQHKCRAADYHFRVLRAEIEQQVERYAKEHKGQSGAGFMIRNEVLLYETEAFLFQAKGAVDMLIRALSPVIPSLNAFDSFRGKREVAGGAVLDALRDVEPGLFDLLERARCDWIQELKELRDQVTHVSELEGLTHFVENQYHGGPHATVNYPTMPSGKRLDVYCGDLVDQLMELTGTVLNELVQRVAAGENVG